MMWRPRASATFSGKRTPDELWTALLASSRMPWAGGEPVEIGGRRYLDGGMAAPIPVREALDAGATHVLALQTRPFGVPRRARSASRTGSSSGTWAGSTRPSPTCTGAGSPSTRCSWRTSGAAPPRAGGAPPHVLGIRPAAGTPCVGQLERRSAVLAGAAGDAERLVETALSSGSWLRAAPAA